MEKITAFKICLGLRKKDYQIKICLGLYRKDYQMKVRVLAHNHDITFGSLANEVSILLSIKEVR